MRRGARQIELLAGIPLLFGLVLATGMGLFGGVQVEAQGYPWSYLALSPDGTLVATVGRKILSPDGLASYPIDLLDADTGELLNTFERAGSQPIDRLTWSPDSSQLVSNASQVEFWNIETAQRTAQYQSHEASPDNFMWSPDGRNLFMSLGRGILSLDSTPGQNLPVLDSFLHEPGQVSGLALNADGSLLAATGGGFITVWNIAAPDHPIIAQFDSTDFSGPVGWSHDGRWLAAGGYGGLVIFDTGTWEAELRVQLPSDGMFAVAWNADDTRVAGSTGETIHVWDATTGEIIVTYATAWNVRTVAWHPVDFTRLYYNGEDGQVYVNGALLGPSSGDGPQATPTPYPAATETPIRSHGPIDQPIAQIEVGGTIFQVAWHPDTDILAVASTQGLTLFDDMLQPLTALYPGDNVSSVTWSPDGDRIAIAHVNHVEVWAWDAISHQLTQETTFEEGGHYGQVAWSPDGAWIAAFRVIDPYDGYGTYIVWDAIARTLQSESPPYSYYLEGISSDVFDWEPNGVPLLLGASYGVADGTEESTSSLIAYTIQAETGERVQTIAIDGSGPYVLAVAWHPAGNLFAVGGMISVEVYSLITGEPVVSIPISVGVSTLDWSPNGRYLIGDDGVADFQNDNMLGTFHSSGPISVAKWNHDGTLLAIAAYDEVRIEDPLLLPDFVRPTQTKPCECDL